MKNLVKMQHVLLLCACIFYSYVSAQTPSWQWGKRGGSFAGSFSSSEAVIGTQTDKNGNVYVLAITSSGALGDVDGHIGISVHDHVSLSSWNCNGDLRWVKNFGSAAATNACGLAVDTLGGVYVAGRMVSNNSTRYGYFDTDTVLAYQTKSMYLLKYDTAGNLQWLRRPEPPDFNVSGGNGIFGSIRLHASPSGAVFMLAYCAPGVYEASFNINAKGYYIFKYNSSGQCESVSPIAITTSNGNTGFTNDGLTNIVFAEFTRDDMHNRFYLYGQCNPYFGDISIGNTPILSDTSDLGFPIFLAAFNDAGNKIWVKQSSANGYVIGRSCKPVVDESGNVYIAGDASPMFGNSFNGHALSNALSPYHSFPFIVSLDSNGNNRWLSSAACNNETIGGALYYKNNKVWLAGAYTDKVVWGNKELDTDVGISGGYAPFLGSFNAVNGSILSMDTLVVSYGLNEPTAIAVDKNNNVYVGGKFSEQLDVAGSTLHNVGGLFDWFVAKLGRENCNCSLPLPQFSFVVGSGNACQFTYTGTSPFLNITWDFGNGATSNLVNPLYVYTNTGLYDVCVTVEDTCGTNTYCHSVQISNSNDIKEHTTAPIVHVYPNPAEQYLYLDWLPAGTTISVYNARGVRLHRQEIMGNKEKIGLYLLRLSLKSGEELSRKFVKE
jgi:hypothetical protein